MSDEINDLIAEAREAAVRSALWDIPHLLFRLADALEARQPSEGEYILKLIESVRESRSSVEIHGVKIMPCDEFGRTAAVPDAATDWQKIAVEQTRLERGRAEQAEAKRDAAVAALERIRAIHERDIVLRDYCSECSDFGSDQFPPGQMVEWPCPTVQALDAAPESDAQAEELRAGELTANEAIGLVLKRPGMYGLVPLSEHRSVKAERDAAVAAIGRVRAIHERDMVLRDYCSECSDFGSDQFPPGQMVEWPCPTIQALDGAHEPEVKP